MKYGSRSASDETIRVMNMVAENANGRIELAQRIVFQYVQNHLDKTDVVEGYRAEFRLDEVYVVWFCKTLQNWKALVSTTLPDGMYYEVTHNGDRGEIYIEAYKKFENQCLKLNVDGEWRVS